MTKNQSKVVTRCLYAIIAVIFINFLLGLTLGKPHFEDIIFFMVLPVLIVCTVGFKKYIKHQETLERKDEV